MLPLVRPRNSLYPRALLNHGRGLDACDLCFREYCRVSLETLTWASDLHRITPLVSPKTSLLDQVQRSSLALDQGPLEHCYWAVSTNGASLGHIASMEVRHYF